MKTKKKKHFINTGHYIVLNERIIHKAHLTIGSSYVLLRDSADKTLAITLI